MNDLIAAIRGAIDETERIATEAVGPDWQTDVAADSGWNSYREHVRSHILRHDPAAALRRCAADRRILDQIVDEANGLDMSVDLDRRVGSRDEAEEPYLGNVLVRLLAEGYGIEVS